MTPTVSIRVPGQYYALKTSDVTVAPICEVVACLYCAEGLEVI